MGTLMACPIPDRLDRRFREALVITRSWKVTDGELALLDENGTAGAVRATRGPMIPFSVLDLAPVVKGSTPASRSVTLSTWRGTPSGSATSATGSPSTTTCPVSPVRRRQWSSLTWPRAPAGSASAPAASCCRITRRSSSPSSSARSSRFIPAASILAWAARPAPIAVTTRALRRDPFAGAEQFPGPCAGAHRRTSRPARQGQSVRAVPGAGLDVPIWLLGSSLYSARARSRAWACRLPSPRTLRPITCSRRSTPTAATSSRPSGSRPPAPWPPSTWSPRRPTRRRAGCSPRSSSSSSTCDEACRDGSRTRGRSTPRSGPTRIVPPSTTCFTTPSSARHRRPRGPRAVSCAHRRRTS